MRGNKVGSHVAIKPADFDLPYDNVLLLSCLADEAQAKLLAHDAYGPNLAEHEKQMRYP